MPAKLIFNEIKKEDIFCENLIDFKTNNEIEFSGKGIAILYGPNGTGKTSFAKVLNGDAKGSYSVEFNGKSYNQNNHSLFHVINDQNNRNIISGDTQDFLLGDDIKREYELKTYIDLEFGRIFKEDISNLLKNEFYISKMKSLLIDEISDKKMMNFVSNIANNKSKGSEINKEEFLEVVDSLEVLNLPIYDESAFRYLMTNYEDKNSIIYKILDIEDSHIKKEKNIKQIEEHDEAIKILDKFDYKEECIVCDEKINREELLSRKKVNREKVYIALDKKTKKILEEIVNFLKGEDPFHIKNILLEAITEGNKAIVDDLKTEIKEYLNIFNIKINNLFANCLENCDLIQKNIEYKKILENKPEMTDEDLLLIEKIVNENIEKNIILIRDEEKNLKLFIGDQELINQGREKLNLSAGEQNFISLAFELLKAKKTAMEIIVLDDPISSFDSIYKNKITYMIIKFLENKKAIILTHNTDLIKLMEHQQQNCFNLYLFNNILNEENGFLRVNTKEQKILLYIDKLIELFRNDIYTEIEDERNFLISMVPFMRGYAQIINSNLKDQLTKLMHGYFDEKINISIIYTSLFEGANKINTVYEISARDILDMNTNNINILKKENYPLLNKTLRHTLNYLYLRLNVEKKLVDIFGINTNQHDQLGQIIRNAFKDESIENVRNRIFLNSRKTLLNEFNHFEGNMNIFQPAIDITDTALENEKNIILDFLNQLQISQSIKSDIAV